MTKLIIAVPRNLCADENHRDCPRRLDSLVKRLRQRILLGDRSCVQLNAQGRRPEELTPVIYQKLREGEFACSYSLASQNSVLTNPADCWRPRPCHRHGDVQESVLSVGLLEDVVVSDYLVTLGLPRFRQEAWAQIFEL